MPPHAAGNESLSITAIEPSGRLYGSEYCLLDILLGLSERAFSWSVVTPGGGGFAELLRDAGIRCHTTLPHSLQKYSRPRRLLSYLQLLREVYRLRPQLLYVNQAGILRAATTICRLLRIPGVCQVQTLEDAFWISRSGIGSRDILAYICNSEFIARHTDVPAERKCVLYQGITSPPVPVPRAMGSDASATLGIIGRVCESKGHYLTLQAAALLKQRGLQIRIRVIGDGLTPSETQRFQNAVSAAGLADTFEFRGYCRNLRAEFSQLQLLLIPSLAEPLGRVLYDAAHFGVPIIAADSGGLGEICRLYGVGQSFPAGNADALAAEIANSLNHLPEITAQFHKQSAQMVQSLNMDSYLRAVQSILLRAASRQPVSICWRGDQIPGLETRLPTAGAI